MTQALSSQSEPQPAASSSTRYKRVLLKISGEAFCQSGQFGIDATELQVIAEEIAAAAKVGAEMGVVVGGGNIIRGAELAQEGVIQQAVADQMGMLGTVINGVALKETLEQLGQPARVLSALNVSSVAETFIRGRALRHLEKGRVVIFVAGTGNPFCTTDSAASLRAAEIGADVLLKATKVDGIYDKDPARHGDAKRFTELGYDEAISLDLKVMDISAFDLCRSQKIPIVVFNMKERGHIAEVVRGRNHGTKVGG